MQTLSIAILDNWVNLRQQVRKLNFTKCRLSENDFHVAASDFNFHESINIV